MALGIGVVVQLMLDDRVKGCRQSSGCRGREVSGSSVCEGVCEAPTFTKWSTMMVSVYPEDSSRALKVYQENQQVGRVVHKVPASEIQGT